MRGFLNSKANIKVDPNEPGLICGLDMKQDIAGTVFDKSGLGNDGTLVGNPRQGCDSLGHYLHCDGSADSLEQGNVGTVKTILMWIDPESTTEDLADLDGGTHTLEITTGTLTATGFVSPALHVNGEAGSTVSANSKQLIVATTATGISASAFDVGLLNGKQYPIAVYGDVKDAAWVAQQYALGKRALWMTQPVNNTGTVTSGQIGDSPFVANSGGFAVVDDSEVEKAIECITAGICYVPTSLFQQTPTEAASGGWKWLWNKADASNMFFWFITQDPASPIASAYNFLHRSSEEVDLQKEGSTTIINGGSTQYAANTWHEGEILRSNDAEFTLNINNALVGTGTDATITESKYMAFAMAAGDKISLKSVIKRLLP